MLPIKINSSNSTIISPMNTDHVIIFVAVIVLIVCIGICIYFSRKKYQLTEEERGDLYW